MKKTSKLPSILKRIFPVILLLCLFLFLLFLPRLISIKKINCSSQYGPCNAQVLSELNKYQNTNYYKAKNEITKILKSSEYVSQFSVKYVLPDILTINLIEKKPSVALFVDNQKYFLINQSGQVVDEVSETLLPKILPEAEINLDLTVGQEVGSELKFAVLLMQKAYFIYNVSQSQMGNDSLSFVLSDGKKVIFPLEGDMDVLFGSLQLILSRLNTEANYSIIDLRFKNPVLR